MNLVRKFRWLPVVVFLLMQAGSLQASKIANNTPFTGTSGTVGNGYIDTYSQYSITSGSVRSTKTVATIGNTTTNGATSAGVSAVVYTSAASRIVGEIDIVGAGTANAEALQILSIVSTTITFTTATTKNHASGETIVRQRDAPLLRPSSENVLNNSIYVKTDPLPASSWRHTVAWLRYVDATDYIKIVAIWNGSTTYQLQVYQCLQGTETNVSSTNWNAAATNVIEVFSSASGTNPTTVTYTVYKVSSSLHIPLNVTSGNQTGRLSATITTGTNSVIQSAGQCGVGAADTGTGFTDIYTEDNTAQTVPITNSNFQAGCSPYNTHTTSTTSIETNCIDWYCKFTFSGSNCSLTLDTSPWQASAGSTFLSMTVDERDLQQVSLTSASTTITFMNAGLWNSAHTVRMYWRSQLGGGTADLWTTPASILKFTNLQIDTGESIGLATILPNKIFWLSDSIGLNPSDGTEGTGIPSPYYNQAIAVSKALNAEVGLIPMGGQGFAWAGSYNVPPLFTSGNSANTAWDKYWAGTTRLVGGLLSPAPTYIIIHEGTNDYLHGTTGATVTSTVAAFIPVLRAAAPGAKIIFLQPLGGNFRWTDVKAGVLQAADSNTIAVDLPAYVSDGLQATGQTTWASNDAIHQNTAAGVFTTAAIVSAINSALAPAATTRSHYRFNVTPDLVFNTIRKHRTY